VRILLVSDLHYRLPQFGWIDQHRPDMVLTGHVHQPPFKPDGAWAHRIGNTWVFNAGHQIGVLVREHRGRVVDAPGDNLLAEFPTALDAVRCAIEAQAVLRARNTSLPAERAWSSGSASTWATSPPREDGSTGTGSTSLRAWRGWPRPAASASPERSASRWRAS